MGMLAVGRSVKTVLAVDDDESVLAGLTRTLGRHRVLFTASDPQTATRVARRERPELAIVDLRLGSTSGIDLVRTLRAFSPDMIIALVSGYLSIDSTVTAVHAGADLVMSKPVTGRDILRRVEGDDDGDWGDTPTLQQAQREHISRVLSDCHGNISEAARRLGIQRSSLQRRLRKQRPKPIR